MLYYLFLCFSPLKNFVNCQDSTMVCSTGIALQAHAIALFYQDSLCPPVFISSSEIKCDSAPKITSWRPTLNQNLISSIFFPPCLVEILKDYDHWGGVCWNTLSISPEGLFSILSMKVFNPPKRYQITFFFLSTDDIKCLPLSPQVCIILESAIAGQKVYAALVSPSAAELLSATQWRLNGWRLCHLNCIKRPEIDFYCRSSYLIKLWGSPFFSVWMATECFQSTSVFHA